MTKKLVLGAIALAVVAAAPALAIDRVSSSEKGSLLIFSKVDIRWDAAGNVIQDTFIDIANDYPGQVQVQMYFVNGDGCDVFNNHNNAEGSSGPFDPSCNSVDVGITLTQNEPTYWSALTGLPKGVSPFTILDPGNPPGRPDPDGSGDYVLRGFVVAWAVDNVGREIKWNHLKGDVTIVNYLTGSAWEYNAYAFQTGTAFSTAATGSLLASPYGTLLMNGSEYEPGFDILILDFYGTGSTAFSGPIPVTVDTDLTLYPIDMDLRQETVGPTTTKATFTVWNQNETKLTGMDRCIRCWDQALVSTYHSPNHFLAQFLQSNKGKAQIDGLASQLCNIDYDDDDGLPLGQDPRDIVSRASSLLGVAAKELSFSRGAEYASAGTNIVGAGTQNATILADVVAAPPPELVPGGTTPVKKPVKGTVTNQGLGSDQVPLE